MKMKTKFECEHIKIEKMKSYGILMPDDSVGEIWCCIPIVEGMNVNIENYKGCISGEYEILYREVLPRQKLGVIRLPKQYMSCDVLLIR